MEIESLLRTAVAHIVFGLKERRFRFRLKYIYERKHRDTLVIVFPAFPSGDKPLYNYYRTVKDADCDKLFLLDDFGYRGSYLMYEGGQSTPEELVSGLLTSILSKYKYKRVITAGSSKGGTCAVYYGLLVGADAVYAGACQYYIGSYLNSEEHRRILEGMMGQEAGEEDVEVLDRKLYDRISRSRGSKTLIHLFYSKQEHTYQEHICPLIRDLEASGVRYEEHIAEFADHAMVGMFFGPFLKSELLK